MLFHFCKNGSKHACLSIYFLKTICGENMMFPSTCYFWLHVNKLHHFLLNLVPFSFSKMNACVCACVSLANDSLETVIEVIVKLGTVVASEMRMHHMCIILTLTFIQQASKRTTIPRHEHVHRERLDALAVSTSSSSN